MSESLIYVAEDDDNIREILRCETAPLAALTAIQYETGGLDTPGKEMSE